MALFDFLSAQICVLIVHNWALHPICMRINIPIKMEMCYDSEWKSVIYLEWSLITILKLTSSNEFSFSFVFGPFFFTVFFSQYSWNCGFNEELLTLYNHKISIPSRLYNQCIIIMSICFPEKVHFDSLFAYMVLEILSIHRVVVLVVKAEWIFSNMHLPFAL